MATPAEKQTCLSAFVQKGVVMVHLDARRPGVELPARFLGQAHLRLDYGYGFTGCVAPKTPVYGNTFMPAAGAKALNKDPKGLTVAIIAEDTDAARISS